MKNPTFKIAAAAMMVAGAFATQTYAAGFQLSEQSAIQMGRAMAGAGIVGDDLSAVHYNPAGMTLLSGTRMQATGTWVAVNLDYESRDGSVTENGPAAEAGLQENDIITAVNGETITGSNDLVKLVKASAAGDTLELTVYRQGQTTTLTLTVGEQKTDALPAQTTDQNQQSQQGYYDGGQSGQSDNQFGGSWPFGFGFGG